MEDGGWEVRKQGREGGEEERPKLGGKKKDSETDALPDKATSKMKDFLKNAGAKS